MWQKLELTIKMRTQTIKYPTCYEKFKLKGVNTILFLKWKLSRK